MSDEESSVSANILNFRPSVFPDACVELSERKDHFKIFGLNNWKDDEEDCRFYGDISYSILETLNQRCLLDFHVQM